MEGSALYLDDGMEAAEGDDGDRLCVRPGLLSPEFLCQNDGPHGIFTVGCGGA